MLLSADELIQLTGYKRPGKQVAALRRMGVRHFVQPSGRPVVDDSALSSKAEPTEQPNWAAIDG